MNRPSLYGAFGDKRALYLAALTRSKDESLACLSQALDAPALRQALDRVWAAAIRIYLAGDAGARGCFVIGTAVVEAVGDPEARRILAETETGLDERFAARFARAAADGELAPSAELEAVASAATALPCRR
ncbi:MAG TPA: hypothetical protein VG939_22330 [Caulobacteraceae bacterium]|nr:hypothetical protein [Caulobacteraceae bacterium]